MNGQAWLPSPYCCCCMPIRCGVIFLGCVELVFVGLSLSARIYYLVEPDATKAWVRQEDGKVIADPVITNQDVDKYLAYVQLGMNAAQLVVILLLIFGVVLIVPTMLIPHLAIQIVNNFFLAAQATIVCLSYGVTYYTIGQAVLWALIILIVFYFTYVVWVCYQYLKILKLSESAPNGFVTRDTSSHMTSL